jgi:endonuclease/exonuclease/phosphatase (EEP) superfamily protein YafD
MDVTEAGAGKAGEKTRGLTVADHLLALWKACRAWVFRGTVLLVGGMACLVWLTKYHAESNLLTVFVAYLPVWVAALPFLATLFAGLLFLCWRSTLVSLVMPVVIILWLGSYSISWGPPAPAAPAAGSFSVMTYNRGQGSDKVLTSFAAQSQPDVAVFQDAARRLPRLAALPQLAGHYHAFQDGEFVLLSRWPLVQNEALQLTWTDAASGVCRAGTRSVIDWEGRRVVVYNIHLPTPRDLLHWYARRGTFLYGLLGLVPHTPLHARHQLYLGMWQARVALVSQLVSRVLAEQDPVILLGDLNLPPAGQGYHALCGVMQDAHAVAGKGFGHTFPSNMKSMARLFAPWIRIDHVFASSGWEVLSSGVSPGGVSQHLPVGAVLRLRESSPNQR